MSSLPLHHQTIVELGTRLRRGELSPVDLTRCFLDRIGELDGRLGAFRLTCPERALEEAAAAESGMKGGRDRGPLHGIPYVVKDLIDAGGMPTSAGSRLLETNVAARDATVTARLGAAGMILIGKTNTVQLAYGGVGVNHDHGTPRNPWHAVHHVPGGSSSGTAVAVAAGMAPAGLGTDTGGSVRIPAALCGITGLKTTVGEVSRAGVYPLSWSLDSVGPLARTVADVAVLYQALQGPDRADPSTKGRPLQDVVSTLGAGVNGLRLAFAEAAFWDDVDPEIAAAVRACGPVFADCGASVTSLEFPEAAEAVRLNPRGLVIASEAYVNHRELLDERFDELDPIVARRMIQGRDFAAHEYLSTHRQREALCARVDRVLRDVDGLLCPTTMIPALPLAEVDVEFERYCELNLAYLRNTSIGNLLGLCGLSIPCGFTRAGLPIGLMVYAKAHDEATLLRIGHAFQQATDWHRRTPPTP